MAKTLSDKVLEDVLSVYVSAELQMLGAVAKHVEKGAKAGWAEGKLASVSAAKQDIEKIVNKANQSGKQALGEGIIDAYTSGLLGGALTHKVSTIDTGGVFGKKLDADIHKAFDFVKNMPQGAIDPDKVFSSVKYATPTMEKAMTKNGVGAQVVGDTIFINKKYEDKIDDTFIVHELGHKVGVKGSEVTPEAQTDAAKKMAKALGYNSPEAMAAFVSDYATKSASELYPEALSEYYKSAMHGVQLDANKKKIVEALTSQMYTKDKGEVLKAQQVMSDANVPMHLQQGILATNKLLDGAAIQVIRNVDDVFSDVQGKSMMGMLAGVDTRIQATQKALNDYANKGITTFKDKSGRNWNLSSYAEMCARTTAAHAALNGHIQRQLEMGEDLMKVSTVGATCPICAPWQGVVLSITGKTPEYKTVGDATAAGLFHPNCKHTLTMHIVGLDGEGKKELNDVKPTDHSQERYNLLNKQRQNERNIRHWKRMEALAITPDAKMTARSMVKKWQHKNLLHCEKNNLRRMYAREGNLKGHVGGKVGPSVGSTFAEKEEFFTKVIGEHPSKVFGDIDGEYFYGAKQVNFEKWLKAEITSLEDVDVDWAYTKDANNKDWSPTVMYKKYIGDKPSGDWKDLGGKEGTGLTYAKWLYTQCKEIGTVYKLKPDAELIHVYYSFKMTEDMSLSEAYTYYTGKVPAYEFDEQGGVSGTGMEYAAWLMNEQKKLINEGVYVSPSFENIAEHKKYDVIGQAQATITGAKVAVSTPVSTPPSTLPDLPSLSMVKDLEPDELEYVYNHFKGSAKSGSDHEDDFDVAYDYLLSAGSEFKKHGPEDFNYLSTKLSADLTLEYGVYKAVHNAAVYYQSLISDTQDSMDELAMEIDGAALPKDAQGYAQELLTAGVELLDSAKTLIDSGMETSAVWEELMKIPDSPVLTKVLTHYGPKPEPTKMDKLPSLENGAQGLSSDIISKVYDEVKGEIGSGALNLSVASSKAFINMYKASEQDPSSKAYQTGTLKAHLYSEYMAFKAVHEAVNSGSKSAIKKNIELLNDMLEQIEEEGFPYEIANYTNGLIDDAMSLLDEANYLFHKGESPQAIWQATMEASENFNDFNAVMEFYDKHIATVTPKVTTGDGSGPFVTLTGTKSDGKDSASMKYTMPVPGSSYSFSPSIHSKTVGLAWVKMQKEQITKAKSSEAILVAAQELATAGKGTPEYYDKMFIKKLSLSNDVAQTIASAKNMTLDELGAAKSASLKMKAKADHNLDLDDHFDTIDLIYTKFEGAVKSGDATKLALPLDYWTSVEAFDTSEAPAGLSTKLTSGVPVPLSEVTFNDINDVHVSVSSTTTTTTTTTKTTKTTIVAKHGKISKVSLGRDFDFNDGKLTKQADIYNTVSFKELEALADQVAPHKFFAKSRNDILGRDSRGSNHHKGHLVDLKPGLLGEDLELGKAYQTVYNRYINKATATDINLAAIKGEAHANPTMKEWIKDMDKAIASVELQEPVTTYRFIDNAVVKGLFGTLDLKGISKGTLVDNKGYMSASVQGHYTYAKRDFMLTIQTDKGSHILPTLNYEEGEFLYGRNGKLEVVDVIDHAKSPKVLPTFKDGDASFRGQEVVVRFIEPQKAEGYQKPDPSTMESQLVSYGAQNDPKTPFVSDATKWVKSLSREGMESLKEYTGNKYAQMNSVFRSQGFRRSAANDWSETLRDELHKATTTAPQVLRRGISVSDLSYMLGGKGDEGFVDKVLQEVNEGGYIAEDKGFMSSSPIEGGGMSKKVELIIYTPTGSKVVYVDTVSSHKGELETIIQAGSIHRVLKMERTQFGGYKVYLELLGTD